MFSKKAECFIEEVGGEICCPFFDKLGQLYVIFSDTGEIMAVKDSNELSVIHDTSGQPNGAIFDTEGVLYAADFAHGAVLCIQNNG